MVWVFDWCVVRCYVSKFVNLMCEDIFVFLIVFYVVFVVNVIEGVGMNFKFCDLSCGYCEY